MKKILSTIVCITSSIFCVAQTNSINFQSPSTRQSQVFIPMHIQTSPVISAKTSANSFQGRYKPNVALPLAHNYTIGGSSPEYSDYVIPVFCDTTTTAKFNSQSPAIIQDMYPGMSFDPKSTIYSPLNTVPLVTQNDPYYLDTVWIGGTYQRRGNMINDTLLVDIVWADTSNLSVFNRFYYNSMPIQSWGTYINPFYTTAVGHGDKVRYSAPATNKIRIKHVLTKADSVYLTNVSNYLPIPINGTLGQLIPAGNIINCGYTFNAGGTHTNGAISVAYGTGTVGVTTSGFAGLMTQQSNPSPSSIANYIDGYDDFGFGKNYSTNITKAQRYGMSSAPFNTTTANAVVEGFWIDFSIHANNTSVGVKNLTNEIISLGQNVPNPFTKESVVKYTLTKDIGSALFAITDVTGRIISIQAVDTSIGTHLVKLGNLAPGLYYYSLDTDGNITTKKMIVE